MTPSSGKTSSLRTTGPRLVRAVVARFQAVTASDLVRDVAKLATGTAGGRLIALAVLPVATRLYSPDDFATLATYLGVVSIVAVIACLRLDLAIPLAKTGEDAANLLVLSLLSALVIGGFMLALTLLAPTALASLLGRPQLTPYLWLVPFGVVMGAGYTALQFWATRARRFSSIARTRITQAVMGATALSGLGLVGVTPLGLLVGNMLNVGAGSFRLGLEAISRDRDLLTVVTKATLHDTLKRYRRYPIYSTPEALANTVGINAPVMLIAAFAGAEAGFLLLATQIMVAPLTLLGSSISQVYMSRAPQEMEAGRLADFTLQVVRRLVQIGIGPIILAGIIAPTLIPFLFGQEWARAGQIISWLTPWMALQLVASPISAVLHLTGRQSCAMTLHILGLLIRVGAVLVAGLWAPTYAVPATALAAAAFYAIYLAVNLHVAGIRLQDSARAITSALSYSAPWIVIGTLFHPILTIIF